MGFDDCDSLIPKYEVWNVYSKVDFSPLLWSGLVKKCSLQKYAKYPFFSFFQNASSEDEYCPPLNFILKTTLVIFNIISRIIYINTTKPVLAV